MSYTYPPAARIPEQGALHRPGICRVCGCTDEHACLIEPRPELANGHMMIDPATCTWVEPDLCSRCHGPKRPTRAQLGELGRIRACKGAILVQPGDDAGELNVKLVRQGTSLVLDGTVFAVAGPTIVLDRRGHRIR